MRIYCNGSTYFGNFFDRILGIISWSSHNEFKVVDCTHSLSTSVHTLGSSDLPTEESAKIFTKCLPKTHFKFQAEGDQHPHSLILGCFY